MTKATRALCTMGIDEAGRGPAIGPMVVAVVCVNTTGARILTRCGISDSKSFGAGSHARSQRHTLAQLVHTKALHVGATVLEPRVIDERVCMNQLNHLERETAQSLIEDAPCADQIIADGERLFGPLTRQFKNLVARNSAESFHVAVAAASIIAKDLRDRLYAEICQHYEPEFGPITGGGYVNAGTRQFLRAYAGRHGGLPPEARRSWPYHYLCDILGDDFNPKAQLIDAMRHQLPLFS